MLKHIAALALAAGGLHLATSPAIAQVDVAEGRRCGFASLSDSTIENGEVQTGFIDGGPIAATAPGATISMKCTIQVGAANSVHYGADSCAVSSAPMLQTTTVPPSFCSYLAPVGQPVYICSEITINGVTYFWDNNPPGSGTWTTSSAAFCAEAIHVDPPVHCVELYHPGWWVIVACSEGANGG